MRDRDVLLGVGRLCVRRGLAAPVAVLVLAVLASSASAASDTTYVVNNGATPGSLTASFSGDSGHIFNSGQGTVDAFGTDPGSSYVVYVTNATRSIPGGVTPITTGSDMAQLPIRVHGGGAIAITPDGTTAYVTSVVRSFITPINLATNTAGFRIPVIPSPLSVILSPVAIAVAPDGATVYVTSVQRNTVTPISIATGREAPIHVGSPPGAIAITPDGETAYVVVSGGVTPLTLATNTPGSPIPIVGGACGIAITPDGRTAYVTGPSGVTPVTIATNTAGASIPIVGGACGIAITPDGRTAYVTGPSGVTPVTIATNTSGSPIEAGPSPAGIAITPDGKTAFVVNAGADTVTPITLATNAAGSPIEAGPSPAGIAIAPNPLRQTSMSVSCSPARIVFGAAGPTCTATVTDIDSGRPLPPIGQVTFTSQIGRGRKVSFRSSCMLSGGGASASCQVTFAAGRPAVYELVASYNGDGVHTLAHALTAVRVAFHSTSTTLACAPTPLVVGRPTGCTATVTDISPEPVLTPRGDVEFSGQDDHFLDNPCRLSGTGATVSCRMVETPTAIGTGSHTITATYVPGPGPIDQVHNRSADSITLPVIDASSTSLTCSPTTVRIGQTTTCTASVSDPAPVQASTPTGIVKFSGAKGDTFAVSPCTLSADAAAAAGCQVSYTPTVGQGPHTLTARYGGDGSHHTSNAKVTVTVTR